MMKLRETDHVVADYELVYLRKNGERTVVGVTAAPGLWDDKPALVADWVTRIVFG